MVAPTQKRGGIFHRHRIKPDTKGLEVNFFQKTTHTEESAAVDRGRLGIIYLNGLPVQEATTDFAKHLTSPDMRACITGELNQNGAFYSLRNWATNRLSEQGAMVSQGQNNPSMLSAVHVKENKDGSLSVTEKISILRIQVTNESFAPQKTTQLKDEDGFIDPPGGKGAIVDFELTYLVTPNNKPEAERPYDIKLHDLAVTRHDKGTADLFFKDDRSIFKKITDFFKAAFGKNFSRQSAAVEEPEPPRSPGPGSR